MLTLRGFIVHTILYNITEGNVKQLVYELLFFTFKFVVFNVKLNRYLDVFTNVTRNFNNIFQSK